MFLLTVCAAILSAATAAVLQDPPYLNSTYHGFKAHMVVASWDDADRICRTEGGYLASPINEDILKDMKHFMEANDQQITYFIGTRARQVRGQYVSNEGIVLDDMPVFRMLEALNPAGGDCLYMNEHRIGVVACETQLPYICRFNNASDSSILQNTTPANTKKPSCSEGYRYSEATGKCYKYHSMWTSWQAAERTCVREGAHLLVINDINEARAIDSYSPGPFVVWLGLRDIQGNGDWRSIDGTPVEQLYNQWVNGTKPINSANKCACLKFMIFNVHTPQKIFAERCDEGRIVMCEKLPE